MPKAFCVRCSNEDGELQFDSVRELFEHEKSGHTIMPKMKEETKPQTKTETPPVAAVVPNKIPEIPKRPIGLFYKYEGACEDCGREVDTIEVGLGAHLMMIAYCPNCKKQYSQTKVLPIKSQFEEKKVN